jgi:hypothetical protein
MVKKMTRNQLKLMEYLGYTLIIIAILCGISIVVHPVVERQEIYHGVLACVGVILTIIALKMKSQR